MKNKGSGCGAVVTVLDRGLSLSICGIALRLVECSAMQADIKGCEFLLDAGRNNDRTPACGEGGEVNGDKEMDNRGCKQTYA